MLASVCCRDLPVFPTYLVRTMETASLRMLSPNTSMLSTGSTCSALKMAMVATGSTADIREPNAKLQERGEGRLWDVLPAPTAVLGK